MNDAASRLPFGLDRVFYGWWIVAAWFLINLCVGALVCFSFTAFFDPLVKEFETGWVMILFPLLLNSLDKRAGMG